MTKKPTAMEIDRMINENKRLIEYEAEKYAQFIPLPVIKAEAYKIARKAAESYDPIHGTKFSTHLYNSLKKLSRISTKYGNAVRVPNESLQFKIGKLNQVEISLRNTLGREPTFSELSRASGFSLKQVTNMMGTRKKEVNVNNLSMTPVFVKEPVDEWLHFVYHDLDEPDKFVFEHKTGIGGKKIMTNEEIAGKLKLSPSTVSNRVKLISSKLEQGLQHYG